MSPEDKPPNFSITLEQITVMETVRWNTLACLQGGWAFDKIQIYLKTRVVWDGLREAHGN